MRLRITRSLPSQSRRMVSALLAWCTATKVMKYTSYTASWNSDVTAEIAGCRSHAISMQEFRLSQRWINRQILKRMEQNSNRNLQTWSTTSLRKITRTIRTFITTPSSIFTATARSRTTLETWRASCSSVISARIGSTATTSSHRFCRRALTTSTCWSVEPAFQRWDPIKSFHTRITWKSLAGERSRLTIAKASTPVQTYAQPKGRNSVRLNQSLRSDPVSKPSKLSLAKTHRLWTWWSVKSLSMCSAHAKTVRNHSLESRN